MSSGPVRICALDLATSTGAADGLVGDQKPRLWTWCLSDAGEGRPERLAYLRRFVDSYIAECQPDQIVYEKPLGIAVIASMMAKRIYMTSEDTLAFLRGSVGVVESCAGFAGIPVHGLDIKAARGHLVGQRTFKDGNAKDATMRACRALGWAPENNDESDAAALWSLACGQANPRLAAALGRAHMAAKDTPVVTRASRGAKALPLFGAKP